MTDTVSFVLLSTQRTGSTWLVSLLDSHPQIRMYGELFHEASGPPPYGGQDLARFAQFRAGEVLPRQKRRPLVTARYLDEVFRDDDAGTVGFKLMYNQLVRFPELVALLRRRRVRVLHLIRQNLLDVVVSREVMRQRGVAHVSAPSPEKEVQVTLDVGKLERTLARLELQVAVFRRLAGAIDPGRRELSYELLVVDSTTQLEEIAAVLGVGRAAAAELSSRLLRPSAARRSERIENYSAVERRLRTTRYARYLD